MLVKAWEIERKHEEHYARKPDRRRSPQKTSATTLVSRASDNHMGSSGDRFSALALIEEEPYATATERRKRDRLGLPSRSTVVASSLVAKDDLLPSTVGIHDRQTAFH